MSEGDDMQGEKLLKWVDDNFPSDQEKSFKKSSKKSLKNYSKKSSKKSEKYDRDQEEELRYQQDIQMAYKASMKSVNAAKRMYIDSDDDIDQEDEFNILKAKRPRGNEPSNLHTFSDLDVATNEPSNLLKFSDIGVASGSGITPLSAVPSSNLNYESKSKITSSPVAPSHESTLEITSSPLVPSLSLSNASATAITPSPVDSPSEYIVLATSNQANKFVSSEVETDQKRAKRNNQQFGKKNNVPKKLKWHC